MFGNTHLVNSSNGSGNDTDGSKFTTTIAMAESPEKLTIKIPRKRNRQFSSYIRCSLQAPAFRRE